jgi:phage gp36-like protein
MTYATAQDMLDRYGVDEIAQRAFRHDDTVDVDLLRATVAGSSVAAWSAGEQTAGANALARINTCLADADKVILGYVRARYGAQPALTTSADLTRVCAELARFYLHDDPLREDSGTLPQSVKTWLADFAAGKVDLDVPAATSDDLVEIGFEEAVMTRTQMDGY